MEARTTERVFDRRLIPEFDGSSQSVAEWLEKLELVCKLCKVVVAAQVIPLRLTGRALPFTSNCPSRTGKGGKDQESPAQCFYGQPLHSL
ncbi:hypothetical protein M513_09325 [Trichuris suis]|uniref:Uncharacterized protein n=1 Tax=Trichuris suis TaxID=68888 RepID=A0A085LY12_9BILA|nr:hypothetical protein M513_09325 [Trichuris suis]